MEKAKKKAKKIAIIATPIVCVCIAFVIVLNAVIIPNQKYNEAMDLIDSGDYESAYALLEEIGKNDVIATNKYDRAMDLIESGDYKSAYALLEELGDSDAIISNKYDRAVALMESGDYDSARLLFKGLHYKDSDERETQCKIEIAKTKGVGDEVILGTWEQDGNEENGRENIEWLVLEKRDNRMLLISDKCLAHKEYNSADSDVTWETCSLRKWMNSEFINSIFNAKEKEIIQETYLPADKNPRFDTDPGNATTDRLFLLSVPEVEKYFPSDDAKDCRAIGSVSSYNYVGWWLRTPGYDQSSAMYVGAVFNKIDYIGVAAYDNIIGLPICVRPAMWISID